MFSSDKNVESIAQLVESVKSYVGLQGEYLKLDVIQKVVRLVTALTLAIVLLLLGIAFLFYLSFACVYWLEPLTGTALAFFLVALFFLMLFILVFINRKSICQISQPMDHCCCFARTWTTFDDHGFTIIKMFLHDTCLDWIHDITIAHLALFPDIDGYVLQILLLLREDSIFYLILLD